MAHILLIDDEADVAARNRAALERHGHQVAVARSPGEAEAELARGAPDALILETMVAGPAAGFELAARLAARLPAARIILLTRADDTLGRATRRAQDRDGWIAADRFFEKPVPPELIADEVEHLLHGGRT
jgi:CheY-like chemotaxis protein